MRFVKYHGLGNDFVVFDLRAGDVHPSPLDPEIARRLCDRRFGVGADGVIGIQRPDDPAHDARMRIINADGSEAEMCGNGIRCLAKYLFERGELRREEFLIETLAGLRRCGLRVEGTRVASVAVDMGAPVLDRPAIPMKGEGRFVEGWLEVSGNPLRVTAVSMGNPHAVTFVEGDPMEAAQALGPYLETHPAFPKRTNAGFARMSGPSSLDLVVWERGCGITLACGTGACAAAVAAALTGRTRMGEEVEVHLPGGTLSVTVGEGLQGVLMRGPAVEVYQGELSQEFLQL